MTFAVYLKPGDSTILSTSRKAARAAMLANHFVPAGESVEVDVVAQQVHVGGDDDVALHMKAPMRFFDTNVCMIKNYLYIPCE